MYIDGTWRTYSTGPYSNGHTPCTGAHGPNMISLYSVESLFHPAQACLLGVDVYTYFSICHRPYGVRAALRR
jgi:hypothetical protein